MTTMPPTTPVRFPSTSRAVIPPVRAKAASPVVAAAWNGSRWRCSVHWSGEERRRFALPAALTKHQLSAFSNADRPENTGRPISRSELHIQAGVPEATVGAERTTTVGIDLAVGETMGQGIDRIGLRGHDLVRIDVEQIGRTERQHVAIVDRVAGLQVG